MQIIVKDVDRYDRKVALVFRDTLNVNEALLKDRLAWHYIFYDKNPTWTELQQQAQKSRTAIVFLLVNNKFL